MVSSVTECWRYHSLALIICSAIVIVNNNLWVHCLVLCQHFGVYDVPGELVWSQWCVRLDWMNIVIVLWWIDKVIKFQGTTGLWLRFQPCRYFIVFPGQSKLHIIIYKWVVFVRSIDNHVTVTLKTFIMRQIEVSSSVCLVAHFSKCTLKFDLLLYIWYLVFIGTCIVDDIYRLCAVMNNDLIVVKGCEISPRIWAIHPLSRLFEALWCIYQEYSTYKFTTMW